MQAESREKEVGERIKNQRKRLGLTQLQLAEKMGVTKSAVAMWETGASSPTSKRLEPLAEILNVTPEWLFFSGKPTDEHVLTHPGHGGTELRIPLDMYHDAATAVEEVLAERGETLTQKEKLAQIISLCEAELEEISQGRSNVADFNKYKTLLRQVVNK